MTNGYNEYKSDGPLARAYEVVHELHPLSAEHGDTEPHYLIGSPRTKPIINKLLVEDSGTIEDLMR